MTLYELSQAQQSLVLALETEEIETSYLEEIAETLVEATEQKLDGYAGLIQQWDEQDKFLQDEIQRLQSRRKSLQNQTQKLKAGLAHYFEQTGQSGFKTRRFTFSYGAQGQRPVEILCDVSELPECFCKVTVEPDKTALRKLLGHNPNNELTRDSDDIMDAFEPKILARLGEQKIGVSIR